MRSSTFSSDRLDPNFRPRHVVLGIALGLLLVGAVEAYWRHLGAKAGYVDSKPRWSWIRDQVADDDVVLVGNSQMQFGFSLPAFRDRYPSTPIQQLAVWGSEPYAVFRDLAEDDDFHGTVIMSLTPEVVMRDKREEQQTYVDFRRNRWTIDARLNFLAGSLMERLLVTRHHNYGVNSVLRSLLSDHRLPQSRLYMETAFDRDIDADYTYEDIESHRTRRTNDARALYEQLAPVSLESWENDFADFVDLAGAIDARGGCVVVVRFPSQDEMYEYEERLFPAQTFWRTIESSKEVVAVHFRELPIMNALHLPDMEHVAKSDKYAFTTELLEAIDRHVPSGCSLDR